MTAPSLERQSTFYGAFLDVLSCAVLALLIYALHGRALDYGLFMDDWAHFRQLRECDWSLSGLTDACRLELVGGIVDYWWLPECTLRFFRPFSFGLMKLTYTVTGWSPAAMHWASLLWHLTAAGLLMVLLRRLGAGRWLSLIVAAMFAIHPGHVATVQWIACQTELMVTTLLLGATLCWGCFRGWPGFTARNREVATRGSLGYAIAALLLFVCALGCRENAIMFPVLLAILELRLPRRCKTVLTMHGVLFALVVVYLLVRAYYLRGVALPPRPYVIPPTDPDFLRFIFDKACYYLMGEFLLVPCVPIGGLPYFRAHPFAFYGLALIAIAIVVWMTVRGWRRGVELLGPVWVVVYFLPALPAFASPHHLYLPGIGWAICAMLLMRSLSDLGDKWFTARRWAWRAVRATSVVLLLGGFAAPTYYFGLAMDVGQQVEDCMFDEIVSTPAGLEDGDTLYVGNLPLLAHYAQLAVAERTGLENIRVVALTWSPRLLGPASPTERVPIDDRTVELRVAGDRFFEGPLGLLVKSATGMPAADLAETVTGRGYRIEVLEGDDSGISRLRFHFDRPLTDPGIHFFWASRARWAFDVTAGVERADK